MFPDLLRMRVHVQNTLLSSHGSAGPYKQRDVPPINYIKNTIGFYNTPPSAIRTSLTKSNRSAIATNSTFLLKKKKQQNPKKRGKAVALNKRHPLLFLERETYRGSKS